VRHGAEFRDDRLNDSYRYDDISIFKMAADTVLDF